MLFLDFRWFYFRKGNRVCLKEDAVLIWHFFQRYRNVLVPNCLFQRVPNCLVSVILSSRYVFSYILFWFPQRTHYFLRVLRFLFMERKQDYNVTSVKNVKVFGTKTFRYRWKKVSNQHRIFFQTNAITFSKIKSTKI
jgi:hypothetical protein